MTLYLELIRSNNWGLPYVGPGCIGHFVLRSDDLNMPVVMELRDGGRYPGYDCAVACTASALQFFGVTSPGILVIEQDEGTHPPVGTYIDRIPDALRELGLNAGGVIGGRARGAHCMNPMLEHVVPWSIEYDAASQDMYIPIYGPAVVQASGTQPTGGTLAAEHDQEDDSMTGNIVRARIKDANGATIGEDIYELNKNGDVWWKHLDAGGKETVNARLAQNGTLNNGAANTQPTGLVFAEGLELTPSELPVGDVEELTGTRASDGQVWRVVHAAGSNVFGGAEVV